MSKRRVSAQFDKAIKAGCAVEIKSFSPMGPSLLGVRRSINIVPSAQKSASGTMAYSKK